MRWLLAAVLLSVPAAAPGQPAARPAAEALPAETALPRSPRPTARLAPPEAAMLPSSPRPASRPATPTDVVPAAGRTPRQDRVGPCGRSTLAGARIPPVDGAGACGIRDAVRITAAGGLALSRPTRMTCATARALDDWVRTGVLPTVGRSGGGAVALQVAAGYSCRTRNSRSGAKLSEHATGNAIDISAIALANGDRLTVLSDWGRGAKGRMLRALWQRACGPFGTVLGPESDRYHRDHFHLDVASYRSGSYCR